MYHRKGSTLHDARINLRTAHHKIRPAAKEDLESARTTNKPPNSNQVVEVVRPYEYESYSDVEENERRKKHRERDRERNRARTFQYREPAPQASRPAPQTSRPAPPAPKREAYAREPPYQPDRPRYPQSYVHEYAESIRRVNYPQNLDSSAQQYGKGARAIPFQKIAELEIATKEVRDSGYRVALEDVLEDNSPLLQEVRDGKWDEWFNRVDPDCKIGMKSCGRRKDRYDTSRRR